MQGTPNNYAPPGGEVRQLIKQKHVLDETVSAFDEEMSTGHTSKHSLVVAGQNVVVEAAKVIVADRSAAAGVLAATPTSASAAMNIATVSELTNTTQGAIAGAVRVRGTGSNDVAILSTAVTLLQEQLSRQHLLGSVAHYGFSALTTLSE